MSEKTKMILLVEDNPDDVELTRVAFERSKIANTMRVARDGKEAVDLLLGDDRIDPAVVLLDLKLPKIEGIEVLRRMRADPRTRMTPVVVLTSSREEQDLMESYELGANSYIQKPVDFEQFMESVRQLGLYWLVLNQRPQEKHD